MEEGPKHVLIVLVAGATEQYAPVAAVAAQEWPVPGEGSNAMRHHAVMALFAFHGNGECAVNRS